VKDRGRIEVNIEEGIDGAIEGGIDGWIVEGIVCFHISFLKIN
jgi:hypothetical protein